MTIEQISYEIRGAAMMVYNALGPGLLESVYHKALYFELTSRGLKVESETPVPIVYKGQILDNSLKLDLLVEDCIIVELKSIEELAELQRAIVRKDICVYCTKSRDG